MLSLVGGSFNLHLDFLAMSSWLVYAIIQQNKKNWEGQEGKVRESL